MGRERRGQRSGDRDSRKGRGRVEVEVKVEIAERGRRKGGEWAMTFR